METIEHPATEELVERVKEQAKEYFKVGLNCSECAFKAFLDLGISDLPPECVALASGFGGGIGTTRNTCGAVLGGCLAVASMKGRKDPLALEDMHARVAELNDSEHGVYQNFRKFIEIWTERHGSICCGELTKAAADEFGFDSVERKRFCKGLVMDGAELGAQLALDGNVYAPNQD